MTRDGERSSSTFNRLRTIRKCPSEASVVGGVRRRDESIRRRFKTLFQNDWRGWNGKRRGGAFARRASGDAGTRGDEIRSSPERRSRADTPRRRAPRSRFRRFRRRRTRIQVYFAPPSPTVSSVRDLAEDRCIPTPTSAAVGGPSRTARLSRSPPPPPLSWHIACVSLRPHVHTLPALRTKSPYASGAFLDRVDLRVPGASASLASSPATSARESAYESSSTSASGESDASASRRHRSRTHRISSSRGTGDGMASIEGRRL